MNRLWVRLSLMIAGVLFFMFFLQFLSIATDDDAGVPLTPGATAVQDPLHADREEIARRLAMFGLFSLVVGAAGGLLIGRTVARPVARLAKAASRIAAGDLEVRVPMTGSLELREAAAGFNAMAASLAGAEEQRRALMADISHELRTPLTVLNGNLRAALDGVTMLDEAAVARLCQQTEFLIRLVNDLRLLALAEARSLSLDLGPLDPAELCLDCLADLRPLAVDGGVELVAELPPLPPVLGDPLRIRQILFNLLSNAIRHSPRDSTVRIEGRASGGTVELAVADTGEGLSAEQVAAVFDRFWRADPSRSRDSGGSGLGLSIARALARAQGGELLAASPGLGRGSRFTLVLPALPASQTGSTEPAAMRT